MAVSPDGKLLYFSHDVSPGDVFEYNKDPNSGVYAINVLELDSGRADRRTWYPLADFEK